MVDYDMKKTARMDITLRNDIEGAKRVLNEKSFRGGYKGFIGYAKVYPFTNELLGDLIPAFKENIQGGHVLAVTGSGDHVFASAQYSPAKITTFDVNKLAYYWMHLKRAGYICLNLAQFQSMFKKTEIADLDGWKLGRSDYKNVRDALPQDVRTFWEAMRTVQSRGADLGKLFRHDGHPYMDNICGEEQDPVEQFYSIKKGLENVDIKFQHKSFEDRRGPYNEAFDAVFLSNIASYCGYPITFARLTKRNLLPLLRKGAKAQVDCEFNPNDGDLLRPYSGITNAKFTTMQIEGDGRKNSYVIMEKYKGAGRAV